MKIINFLRDYFFQKEIIYIEDQTSFDLVLEDIQTEKMLAIDTEFIWRNTYFPKLSLVQVCTENRIYLLDCLSVDISKIKKALSDHKIIKIFHSVRGDSSVLYNCLGIKLKNTFDTQLAEDLLNDRKGDQISLKKLVKKYFLKDISKSETNSDWENRPLRKKQLDYAAEDVRYLHTIMKIQNNKLRNLNKIDSFNSLCINEIKLGEEDFSSSRLKRYRKKNRNISEIEIKVFVWRESQAEKLNVPPSHIIEDRDLRKIKKIIEQKKINEFKWIIKKSSSRDEFVTCFL